MPVRVSPLSPSLACSATHARVRPVWSDSACVRVRSPRENLASDRRCHLSCTVINQVDTSQGQFSAKADRKEKDPSKPADLSKDELTAVLKYGAQKMCVPSSVLVVARSPVSFAVMIARHTARSCPASALLAVARCGAITRSRWRCRRRQDLDFSLFAAEDCVLTTFICLPCCRTRRLAALSSLLSSTFPVVSFAPRCLPTLVPHGLPRTGSPRTTLSRTRSSQR